LPLLTPYGRYQQWTHHRSNLSYDESLATRFSADPKYHFGSNGYGASSKKKAWQSPVIQDLSSAKKHRDVRVHGKVNGAAISGTGTSMVNIQILGLDFGSATPAI